MNTTPPAILAETVFDIQDPHGRCTPIPIELSYTSGDPYAVTMRFFARPGEAVTWLVSRALLAEGLCTAAGLGDIRFRPLDNRTCVIDLRSEKGAATCHAPADDLRRFLDTTYDLVPLGQESTWIDFDHELELLATVGDDW